MEIQIPYKILPWTIWILIQFLIFNHLPSQNKVTSSWFVQEYFPDPYLDDATYYGDGIMFIKFRTNKPDLLSHYLAPDTVYIVPNGPPLDYRKKRYIECFEDASQYFDSSQKLKNKSLIRGLRRASIAPEKIRTIEYRKVYLTYQMIKIEKREHLFLYMNNKKRRDGLFEFRRVVCVYIECV